MKSIDDIVGSQLRARSFALTRANLGLESDDAFHQLVEALIAAPEDDRFTIAGYHRNAAGLYAIVYCEPRTPVYAPRRRGRGHSTGSSLRVGLGSPAIDAARAKGAKGVPGAFVDSTTEVGDLT